MLWGRLGCGQLELGLNRKDRIQGKFESAGLGRVSFKTCDLGRALPALGRALPALGRRLCYRVLKFLVLYEQRAPSDTFILHRVPQILSLVLGLGFMTRSTGFKSSLYLL